MFLYIIPPWYTLVIFISTATLNLYQPAIILVPVTCVGTAPRHLILPGVAERKLFLPEPCINQGQLDGYYEQDHAVKIDIHSVTPSHGYLNKSLNDSTAGPIKTTKRAGNTKNTSGNIILMAVFAAASSAI